MISVIKHLVTINLKVFRRQPETIFWAIVFPLILFWILGIAFDNKKELKITVGVITAAQHTVPAWLSGIETQKNNTLSNAEKKARVIIKKYPTQSAAITELKQGKVSLFLESDGLKDTYYFDPQNNEAQTHFLILEKLKQNNTNTNPPKIIPLKAKGTRYIDFFLPGLLAFNMMSACLWGIGWDLIEIRMKKYLKRLMATPIYRSHYIIALIISRLLVSAFEMSLLLVFAYCYFGISIQGSVWAFVYLFLLGNITFSGVAVLIGSRTANSATGNGLINACVLPMMITSGIFFNYHHFPEAVIPIIQCLPLTILADSLRAVCIEGATITTIFLPSLWLWAIAFICYWIGLKIFRWY